MKILPHRHRNRKIVSSILICFLCAAYPGFAKVIAEENPDLENAIIIEGLRIDEGDEEFFGEIIYHTESEAKPAKKRTAPKSTGKNSRQGVNLMDSLREEDARWHLSSYTIKKKDNLWNIAIRFDTDYKLILQVNAIADPSRLLPGKTILVPNRLGCYYHVRQGDTLSRIALKYKSNVDSIASANGIKNSVIRINQKLFIPDGREIKEIKATGETRNKEIAKPNKSNAAQTAQTSRKSVAASAAPKASGAEKASGGLSLIWPIKGLRVTSGFGTRKDPFDGSRRFHSGIDISANEGTQVKAAGSGKVIFSGWKDGYGKTIILRHENGYITVYAHNSKTLVKEGAEVKRGHIIALSGQTGAVTGAHLHFEVRKYLTPLNPMRFLK